MLINFTISYGSRDRNTAEYGHRYVLEMASEIVPAIDSTICFACNNPTAKEGGYYFKVKDVIYYPLPRGSVQTVMNGNMRVQVFLENSYISIKDLVSRHNTLSPGVWKRITSSYEQ